MDPTGSSPPTTYFVAISRLKSGSGTADLIKMAKHEIIISTTGANVFLEESNSG